MGRAVLLRAAADVCSYDYFWDSNEARLRHDAEHFLDSKFAENIAFMLGHPECFCRRLKEDAIRVREVVEMSQDKAPTFATKKFYI